MKRGPNQALVRDLDTLCRVGTLGGLTDRELLEHFTSQGSVAARAAFEVLVHRHGAMVLGVCRRVLGDEHAAEDAFQATFLVLALKAGAIRKPDSLGPWLHGVAARISRRAKAVAGRRREEPLVPVDLAGTAFVESCTDNVELRSVLDEEIARLPASCRRAVVLCILEGKTQEQAAQVTGWTRRRVVGRLARARDLLRSRLTRRGFAPAACLIETLLAQEYAEAAVSTALANGVVRTAMGVLLNRAETLAGQGKAVVFARGLLRGMLLTQIKAVGILLVVAAFATALAQSGSRPVAPGQDNGHGNAPPNRSRLAATFENDSFGDPLPDGVVARLGTVRFRSPDGSVNALRFSADGKRLVTVSDDFTLSGWETRTGRLLHDVRSDRLYAHAIAFSADGKLIALEGTDHTDVDPSGFHEIRRLVDTATGKEIRRLPVLGTSSSQALAFTPDGKFLMTIEAGGILHVEEVASGTELLQQRFPRDKFAALAISPDGKTLAIWSGAGSRKLFVWEWQRGDEPRAVALSANGIRGNGIRRRVFSPDGKFLAAYGAYEPFIDVWDMTTGCVLNHLELRKDCSPSDIAFEPNGKTIAVSDLANRREKPGSGGVLLVDRDTGKTLREFPTPGTPARRVAFSPDGRWIAVAGRAGVHVWDLHWEEEVAAGAAGHQGAIGQIAVSRAGIIATASDDHTVRIWDAVNGKEKQQLQHANWVRALALSPDASLLVSSSLDDLVHVWELRSGKEIHKLPGHGRQGGYRTVGFAPDGQRVLSWGDDLKLRVWDVDTGKAVFETGVQMAGMTGPAAFTADGKRLIATISGAFHIIDVATGRVEHSLRHPGGFYISSLAVAPDGKLFATSGWGKPIVTKLPDGRSRSSTPNHHPVCLVETATGKLVRELEMPTSNAGPVAFSADGKLLAIGFGRGRGEVRMLDMTTQKTVGTLKDLDSGPHAMTFSPDGKYLITGLHNQTSLVWDMAYVLAKRTKEEP